MTAQELLNMTEEKLLEQIVGAQLGSQTHEDAKAALLIALVGRLERAINRTRRDPYED